MPILDLFFVFAKLLFEFADGRIDGTHQVFRLVVGDKIVLVLGGDLEIDSRRRFIGQIDNHFDGGQSIVNPRQFFDFRGDLFLRCFAELTMPSGNFDLHQPTPVALCQLPGRRPGRTGPTAVNGPF